MGIRFQKSVKICKGVKVNFSKSGASLSLGGRGNRITMGSKGVRRTVGIPGTGISYSTTIGSRSSTHKSHSPVRSSSGASHKDHSSSNKSSYQSSIVMPSDVHISMNPDGKIIFKTSSGQPITDDTILRKIKATEAYKAVKNDLEFQRQQYLTRTYNASVEENNKLINIHKMSPSVDSPEEYIRILETLKPLVYQIPPFDIPAPTIENIRFQLTNEAQTEINGNIFKIGKLRKQYVEDNTQKRYAEAVEAWEQNKKAYLQTQHKKEIEENSKYQQIFEEDKAYMLALIRGYPDVICNAIEDWISTCELPLEFNIDYDFIPERNMVFLDVDLPEIEDIPDTELIQLVSGNLKEKKKSQATLKQEYVTLVLGLAIFISANVFNVSPAIQLITISGYTQRRNKDGDINDDYVYSIIFDREVFQKSVLANVVPKDFCSQFQNRMNITSSMIMKKITPFDIA